MEMQDIKVWARGHRRLSAGAIRRRFMVSRQEAERLIQDLLRARVLHPGPDSDSYRVRYPKVEPGESWLAPEARRYRYEG